MCHADRYGQGVDDALEVFLLAAQLGFRGDWSEQRRAWVMEKKEFLARRGFSAHVATGVTENAYRVLVGPLNGGPEIEQTQAALQRNGFSSFLKRYYRSGSGHSVPNVDIACPGDADYSIG
jgi:hypothetical protein